MTFNDIRNIVNLVNLYTPAHALIKKTMDQATAKANGMQVIPIDSFTKTRAAIGLTTLVAPFVADKLSDDSKPIASRIGSILPIPFIGSIVRSIVSKSNNTKVQGVYQIANAAINPMIFIAGTGIFLNLEFVVLILILLNNPVVYSGNINTVT